MSFTYEDKPSDSPFVETIWHTRTNRSGHYLATADGNWDILIRKRDRIATVMVCGPTTKATPVPYEEGVETIGIQFKLGVFMPQFLLHTQTDSGTIMPDAMRKSFWLGGSVWQIPDYENVDSFVARLVRADLLVRDPIVAAALQGQSQDISERSVQRRFLRTTGLPQRYIQYIERARQAVALLQQGVPILDTVFQAGYSDQPHMTKALKRLIGQTPAQIARQRQSE